MTMIAFMQAQNCSNFPGSWRHKEAMPDFLSAKHYQRIARTLEESKFHLAFFDDRLAMPDLSGDYDMAVRHGVRTVKMDLDPALDGDGDGYVPARPGGHLFHHVLRAVPRRARFATLDLMIEGRAAWNVVTSLNDSEAANFGQDQHLEHDLRYDRADEFIEVVMGHWATWADDAIVADRSTGVFADPAKVKALNHVGKWFKSRGPFTVPRSPQGHPVIMQAGQSGRGMAFAARWGEVVFASLKTVDGARKQYRELKDAVTKAGRDPDKVKLSGSIFTILGETRSVAEEKRAMIEALAVPEDSLTLLSEALNFDFGSVPFEQRLSDEQMGRIGINLGIKGRVVERCGTANPAPKDFVEISKRGTVNEAPVFCGTAQDVADEMEAWFTAEACDGFILAATHRPGAYEEFGRLVVPELQRRGLFHLDYAGPTLRENLGLDRPVVSHAARPGMAD